MDWFLVLVVFAEIVESAVFFLIPVLFIGGISALLIAGLSTISPSASLFVRIAQAGLAVVLAVDSLLLIPYAQGEDTYYGGGVTRWEHASRSGSTFPITAAIGGAWLTGFALGWIVLTRDRPRIRPLVGLAAAASCFLLIFAWLMLTAGH